MSYTVASLFIYPIKGLSGMAVPSMELLTRGAQWDRRFMLVDDHGKFLSQRSHVEMCTFWCEMDDESIYVYRNDAALEVSLSDYTDQKIEVEVWGASCIAFEVSPQASDWFSKQLNTSCKLVRMVEGHDRIKNYSQREGSTMVSFADGYPYLILGTASMRELNSKMVDELPVTRFRPNIVIHTKYAHEEDDWNTISINERQLEIIKPCARCIVTTIDQSTGEKGTEPLKTLASYRKVGNKIMFGANASLLTEGQISLGDPVEIN